MDSITVKQELVKVLQQIQSASGLPCPSLNGTIKPVDQLPEFDSKMWPVAIGMLAQALGVEIADDINIFRQDHSTTALTLDETVAKVMAVAKAMAATSTNEVPA